jgi:hypothetical protein
MKHSEEIHTFQIAREIIAQGWLLYIAGPD